MCYSTLPIRSTPPTPVGSSPATPTFSCAKQDSVAPVEGEEDRLRRALHILSTILQEHHPDEYLAFLQKQLTLYEHIHRDNIPSLVSTQYQLVQEIINSQYKPSQNNTQWSEEKKGGMLIDANMITKTLSPTTLSTNPSNIKTTLLQSSHIIVSAKNSGDTKYGEKEAVDEGIARLNALEAENDLLFPFE